MGLCAKCVSKAHVRKAKIFWGIIYDAEDNIMSKKELLKDHIPIKGKCDLCGKPESPKFIKQYT